MFNATLVSRVDLNDELCVLRILPDAGVPAFEAGQFVRLGLYEHGGPKGDVLVKRAYSMASSPHEQEGLEFYVVKTREGRLTPELWELGLGDRLWTDNKPQGDLILHHAPPESRLLMLATGTGIAPFVSMLRAYAGKQRWQSFTLVHGTRRLLDLGYREELEALARRHPDVHYVPILSRDLDAAWSGQRGRVLQALEPETVHRLTGGPLVPGDVHVFLCGNPDMIQGARALLEPRGFVASTKRQPGTIHTERYW